MIVSGTCWHRRYEQLVELEEHIAFYTNELELLSQQDDEACQRLQTIPGFGPIVSSAFRSAIGDGRAYAHGRDASASLGWFPASIVVVAKMFCLESVNGEIVISAANWFMVPEPLSSKRPGKMIL